MVFFSLNYIIQIWKFTICDNWCDYYLLINGFLVVPARKEIQWERENWHRGRLRVVVTFFRRIAVILMYCDFRSTLYFAPLPYVFVLICCFIKRGISAPCCEMVLSSSSLYVVFFFWVAPRMFFNWETSWFIKFISYSSEHLLSWHKHIHLPYTI